MHRKRETRTQPAKQLIVGLATALTLTFGVAVATWDPTEALCAIYTPDDPMWHLLACWRFPAPGGAPQG